jgi:hypothetical protein
MKKKLLFLIIVLLIASQGYAMDIDLCKGKVIGSFDEIICRTAIVLIDKTVTREHATWRDICNWEWTDDRTAAIAHCNQKYDIRTCYKIGTSDGTVIAEFCDTKPEEK